MPLTTSPCYGITGTTSNLLQQVFHLEGGVLVLDICQFVPKKYKQPRAQNKFFSQLIRRWVLQSIIWLNQDLKQVKDVLEETAHLFPLSYGKWSSSDVSVGCTRLLRRTGTWEHLVTLPQALPCVIQTQLLLFSNNHHITGDDLGTRLWQH